MRKTTLNAKTRTVTGRKVKKLRQQQILPGNVYGKKVKSQVIEVNLPEFTQVYKQAGETNLIDLVLNDQTIPVLIQNVQTHAVTGTLLHVDFKQVDLKEKAKANVPLVLEGKSPAVLQKLGVLLQITNEVEIESLPTDIPAKIVVDITKLSVIGDTIKIANLKTPEKVKILTSPETEIVKISQLVTKEAEELAKAEEAAKTEAAAKATTTTTEQATPTTEVKSEAAPTIASSQASSTTAVDKK